MLNASEKKDTERERGRGSKRDRKIVNYQTMISSLCL